MKARQSSQRRKHGKARKKFLPPAMEKIVHHIVPVSWQKMFAAPALNGRPYYKNVKTGECKGPEGPGKKMSIPWANVTFDSKGFPLDQLENRLGSEETRLIPILRHVVSVSSIDPVSREQVAQFLAMQICRYPEHYESRLSLGKLLAIDLLEIKRFVTLAEFHAHLHRNPCYTSMVLRQAEFDHMRGLSDECLCSAVEALVNAHLREEQGLNPNSVIDAMQPVASILAGYEWRLLQSPQPAFIISDRPIPTSPKQPFAVGLSASFALEVDPFSCAGTANVIAVDATPGEIQAINSQVAGRAVEWLCGPMPF